MRTILASLVLALVLLAPSEARAQYPSFYYGNYYTPPVYTYPSYVAPYYSPYVAPYTPPYVWSGRYYNNPFTRGWSYQAYSPYTNQYFYRYRTRPNYWGW